VGSVASELAGASISAPWGGQGFGFGFGFGFGIGFGFGRVRVRVRTSHHSPTSLRRFLVFAAAFDVRFFASLASNSGDTDMAPE
jgi:NhaP-type Na+/H+ or K+/H+ antiporter